MISLLLAYFVYAVLGLGLTLGVACALDRVGRGLLEGEVARRALVPARVVVVPFVLLNLGFLALNLQTGRALDGAPAVAEVLADKLGVVLLVLGGTWIVAAWILGVLRAHALLRMAPPPAAPDEVLLPARPAPGGAS